MHSHLRRSLATAVVVLVALATTASAIAATYVRSGSTFGPVLTQGSSLAASLSGGTTLVFTFNNGSVTCSTGSFAATIGTNPSSGSVAATLNTFSGGTCVDAFLDAQFQGVALASAGSGSITSTASGANFLFSNVVLRWTVYRYDLMATVTCDYTYSTLAGTYANSSGALAFTNGEIAHNATPDPAYCTTLGSMSATYGPITSGGNRVYVTSS